MNLLLLLNLKKKQYPRHILETSRSYQVVFSNCAWFGEQDPKTPLRNTGSWKPFHWSGSNRGFLGSLETTLNFGETLNHQGTWQYQQQSLGLILSMVTGWCLWWSPKLLGLNFPQKSTPTIQPISTTHCDSKDLRQFSHNWGINLCSLWEQVIQLQ